MVQIVRHHLRPEFVNRIDEIIVFRALTKEQIADIARLLLDRTRRRLRAQDVELEFTDEAVDLVAAEGFDPEFGARPLRRTIQRKVDNELSRMLLEGSLNSGDRVVVGVEDGKLSFEALEESALVGTESGDEPGE
jgi:ATP-dependent Clp protease ATP-binding subunit ClpC